MSSLFYRFIDIINRTLDLPKHFLLPTEFCLFTTYFRFNGDFYEQTNGTAMGSPLSPVIAHIFMTDSEIKRLQKTEDVASLWLRYVDDIFLIWEYGRKKLEKHLMLTNNLHSRIIFTKEIEKNNRPLSGLASHHNSKQL